MPKLDVFLANPIITQIELPPLDVAKMRLVYSFGIADGEDEEVLEHAFRALNINHPSDYHDRSLSVGDVVTIAGARSYRCDWLGWQKLEQPLLAVGRDYPILVDELEAQLAVEASTGVNTGLAVELLDWLHESPTRPVVVAIPPGCTRNLHWYRSLVAILKRITARLCPFRF